jgi:hypothetical protein
MSKSLNCILLIVLTGLLAAVTPAAGKSSGDDVWEKFDGDELRDRSVRRFASGEAVAFYLLNKTALQTILSGAPPEFSTVGEKSRVILTLPMPDGTFERFAIKESPIMAPELAAKFPEIKTWLGQGIDNPTATTRFDLTPNGFHAMIISDRGTVYVDPHSPGDTENYVSFNKSNALKTGSPFTCHVGGLESSIEPKAFDYGIYTDTPNIVVNGGTLRQYRLAVAATGEYTQAVGGGTVPGALAAITTTMNRVNGVYERDLSLRMNLVANNDLVIYTDGATDPYSNNSGGTMLGQNTTNLNTVIGTDNYDIGHVFSTGGGGVATLNAPCDSNKARGVTGLSNPQGDVFDIDYVAHEMGHQWGGSHTFNGSSGSCSGGNRSSANAYEPGSGSTIQAYAGICGSQNIQSNSNDYFHVRSLEQIVAFITNPSTGGSCSAETADGNTAPTVSVSGGTTFNIPRNTPFALTAEASDSDGDNLTYTWEEYSLGSAGAPGATADAPMFRSNLPNTSPTRFFPALNYVLNSDNVAPTTFTGTSETGAVCGGNCLTAEYLPSISRTMPFQVTVRDNRAGGGGVRSTTATVTVDASSGPFKVTAQDSLQPPNWQAGTTHTVTWDVAGTSAAPVGAANVDIHLSTDGGQTFPHILAAGTPNDGAQNIVVPNAPTSQARIRVRAADNIFFDISNVNFTVLPAAAVGATLSGRVLKPNGYGIGFAVLTLVDTNTGTTRTAFSNPFGYFRFQGLPVGNFYTLTVGGKKYVFPDDTQSFTLNGDLTGITFIGN